MKTGAIVYIICMHAEVLNSSKIRLTGRELRLCG